MAPKEPGFPQPKVSRCVPAPAYPRSIGPAQVQTFGVQLLAAPSLFVATYTVDVVALAARAY
jgi:hypothetical protein